MPREVHLTSLGVLGLEIVGGSEFTRLGDSFSKPEGVIQSHQLGALLHPAVAGS